MKKIVLGLLSLALVITGTPVQAATSQQILNEGLAKMEALKTGNFTASIETTSKFLPVKPVKNTKVFSFSPPKDSTIKVTAVGSFDDTDLTHPKVQMNLRIDPGASISTIIKDLNLDVIKDNLTYYIFWNLPQLPKDGSSMFDVSMFGNKWIKFDLTGLLADLKETGFTKTDTTKLDE
ncbi:MAG: hypothetical protein NT034_00510, partial [Candidatus Magasanikbacteria bacterium]|nr:hypothetical protein [Candidatus Magasanikbacteria bacterium]